jgi:UDP-N-acetylglucosamine/UDP-N-acetylgalactosamine 4-epimerase
MYNNPFHKGELSKVSILVTGGAGFIGSNLVEYLLKYNIGKVRVLDNLSNGYLKNIEPFFTNPSFEFIEGDIRDIEICKKACLGIDFVLHQAALGSVPRSINDPITSNDVNVGGFLNMLVAARDASVKRFVYAASSSTYGDSKILPKKEPNIGKPLSPYAVTKYVNELYADVFFKTYGLNCIGLRYFNVFGPRQDPKGAYAAVIPLFIDALVEGKSPTINGDGEQTRDFTFVENAVEANIKSLFAPEESLNKIYNVAVGENTSLNSLFSVLKKLANSGLSPAYGPDRKGDVRDSLADIALAKEFLGYNPAIRIEKGLEITYNWFINNKEFIKRRN